MIKASAEVVQISSEEEWLKSHEEAAEMPLDPILLRTITYGTEHCHPDDREKR